MLSLVLPWEYESAEGWFRVLVEINIRVLGRWCTMRTCFVVYLTKKRLKKCYASFQGFQRKIGKNKIDVKQRLGSKLPQHYCWVADNVYEYFDLLEKVNLGLQSFQLNILILIKLYVYIFYI